MWSCDFSLKRQYILIDGLWNKDIEVRILPFMHGQFGMLFEFQASCIMPGCWVEECVDGCCGTSRVADFPAEPEHSHWIFIAHAPPLL